jgi:AcrR family transcriptional regulator
VRKAQIIDNATALFAERGFDGVTTREIAIACDVSEAALYKHFESKEQLYDQVLKSIIASFNPDPFFETMQGETDIHHVLDCVAHSIIDLYKKDYRTPRLLLYSSLNTHPRAKQIFVSVRMPYVKFLSAKLKELIEKGLIRKIEPEITERCFVGMVFDCSLNLNLWKGMSGKAYEPDAIVKNNVGIYVDGLKIRPI